MILSPRIYIVKILTPMPSRVRFFFISISIKKGSTFWWILFYAGRGRRTRTLDTRFWRPLLYQLSYTPIYGGEDGIRTHAALNEH